MEQVIEAAKIANAHDFIMETEKGYDTMMVIVEGVCPVVSVSVSV